MTYEHISGVNNAQKDKMIKKLGHQLMTMQANNKSIPRNEDEAKHRNYQFWSTQPVPTFNTDTQVACVMRVTICVYVCVCVIPPLDHNKAFIWFPLK